MAQSLIDCSGFDIIIIIKIRNATAAAEMVGQA